MPESQLREKEIQTTESMLARPMDDLLATVHFRVKCNTNLGEEVAVVGSQKEFGNWRPEGALLLTTDKDSYVAPFHSLISVSYH